ncbi:hypothetical protein [Tissierella sp.]|uniref:hypothetical protein n=1 Tax=Tissierella sp. TaxID=41274 RepID=UPI0028AE1B10|nr:hypothetical protein [Tissierella sp.]
MNDSQEPQIIKVELEEKFGQAIVYKALQQLNVVMNKGTVVNNLKNYLEAICTRLKAQIDMINGISQVIDNKPQKTKNNGVRSVANGWKSSNITFDGRSSNYSNEELEEIMLRKRNNYIVSK